ncbi:MAG: site-2 protease family protein [Chloroflexi bacterium]|nr:site-2 protease family protein [Anaerolinea sp.]TDA63710.1 MAG: site-2 protease family protein [Chloroflexota bacterium]
MLGLDLPTLISRILTLVIALSTHEFAHAKVADLFGDNTPRMNGRLTLNPLKHLDIFGSLMLLVAGFGWAKPVPVNPYALAQRSPSAFMWVSLAGPASNFLMAIAAAIPLRAGWVTPYNAFGTANFLPTPYDFLTEFIFINLLLMLFNLIPLAPLDGDKIYSYFAPPPLARVLDVIRPYGPIVLMLLVFLAPRFGFDVFGWMMSPALPNLWILLLGGNV